MRLSHYVGESRLLPMWKKKGQQRLAPRYRIYPFGVHPAPIAKSYCWFPCGHIFFICQKRQTVRADLYAFLPSEAKQQYHVPKYPKHYGILLLSFLWLSSMFCCLKNSPRKHHQRRSWRYYSSSFFSQQNDFRYDFTDK